MRSNILWTDLICFRSCMNVFVFKERQSRWLSDESSGKFIIYPDWDVWLECVATRTVFVMAFALETVPARIP